MAQVRLSKNGISASLIIAKYTERKHVSDPKVSFGAQCGARHH